MYMFASLAGLTAHLNTEQKRSANSINKKETSMRSQKIKDCRKCDNVNPEKVQIAEGKFRTALKCTKFNKFITNPVTAEYCRYFE